MAYLDSRSSRPVSRESRARVEAARTPQSSKRPSQRISTSSKKYHRAGSTATRRRNQSAALQPSTRRPTHWLISTQDRTIVLEAPVTLIGATAVRSRLMEIQRQIHRPAAREAAAAVLFLAATRMLKAARRAEIDARPCAAASYAVIKKARRPPAPTGDVRRRRCCARPASGLCCRLLL